MHGAPSTGMPINAVGHDGAITGLDLQRRGYAEEACSGLNSLSALVVGSLLLGHVFFLPPIDPRPPFGALATHRHCGQYPQGHRHGDPGRLGSRLGARFLPHV